MNESKAPGLSIIIPTLNEIDHLGRVLDSIGETKSIEVLVADGGSSDGTVELARRRAVPLVESPRGRARQLNRAAAKARGQVFLFLHADTRLPPEFPIHIEATLAAPHVVLGAFRLGIEGQGLSLRLVERVANLRSRFLSCPYGDQALFLKRETFHELRGFREIPLMEDYDLVRRARRLGRIGISPAAVQTSDRRWRRLGLVRTTLLNWWIVVAFRAGVDPDRLAKWYGR